MVNPMAVTMVTLVMTMTILINATVVVAPTLLAWLMKIKKQGWRFQSKRIFAE